MSNSIQTAVNEAANIMSQFSPEIAEMFRTQPFNRVDIAVAFAAGFVKNDSDDPNPTAMIVMKVAFMDRESRRIQ